MNFSECSPEALCLHLALTLCVCSVLSRLHSNDIMAEKMLKWWLSKVFSKALIFPPQIAFQAREG